jgi:cytochrome c-type biogenesis protein CcmH/NrfG
MESESSQESMAMANENATPATASTEWQVKQVFTLAIVCLMIGLAVGYLFRGSRSPAPPVNAMPASAAQNAATPGMGGQRPQITLDQMKQMADKQAEPLLAKLKDDPKNADLLIQIGGIYFSTHQFQEAADYFSRSLEVKPKNIAIRTQLASCLYYAGDADGAIKQLAQATTDDPKDANSLFNLGYIRWQAKKDSQGALAAWAQLLKTNPQLEPAKKAQVEKLMADVRQANVAN